MPNVCSGWNDAKQTYKPTDLQTYRPTDLQTYRPTDLQTYRPTNLQTYRPPEVIAKVSQAAIASRIPCSPSNSDRVPESHTSSSSGGPFLGPSPNVLAPSPSVPVRKTIQTSKASEVSGLARGLQWISQG